MSPSGRESDSDVSSYMDGVPVKISERYRPPQKVVLPVGFQHRLVSFQQRLGVTLENALRDTAFDFSQSRNVIENTRLRREQKVAIRENRKARIAAEDERKRAERDKELAEKIDKINFNSDIPIAECDAAAANLPSTRTSTPPIVAATTSLQTMAVTSQSQFSSILTPQPMPAPSKISSPKVPVKSAFNLSDFEADTSSPFDNMELKTINDMEELAHVLQPNCASDIRPKNNYQYSNYYSQSNTTSNNIMLGNEQENKKSVMNTYGGYGHISSMQSNESHLNGPSFPSNHQTYMFPTQQHQPLQTPQQQQCSSYYYGTQQSWMFPPTSTYSYVPPQYDATQNCSKSYAYPPPTNNLVYTQPNTASYSTVHSTHSTLGDQNSRSRTSKSVPDIMEELQKEGAVVPSRSTAVAVPPVNHLPPPRPASFGSTGLENWKPWPELDSPADTQEKCVPPPVLVQATGNPLANLAPDTQQIARQLSEMGFPLARVGRAFEVVGHDHKKVLDYLLQVQALEERGFPGSRVELALGKLRLDESKALKFLPALGQLMDLGFPEERVSQVLLQFDFDRDKALDALLS